MWDEPGVEGERHSGPWSQQESTVPMLMGEMIRMIRFTKSFHGGVIKRKRHRFLVIWSPLHAKHLEGNSGCYLINEK